MIELRYFVDEYDCYADGMVTRKVSDPVLQYRALFCPYFTGGGDIVLEADNSAEWVDVPTVHGDKDGEGIK